MRQAPRSITIVLAAGLAALAVSCIWWDDLSGVGLEPRETPTERRDQAKAEVVEATAAMRYLAGAQKAELADRLTQEVVEIQAGIDRLATEADRVRGAARELARATLEAMRQRWTLAMKRLETAERATRSTWDEVRSVQEKAAPRCGMGSKIRACG